MKLALSVLAENLSKVQKGGRPSKDDDDAPLHSFCAVALLPQGKGQPTILGRSETIHHSRDPDYCHMFIIDEYHLGQSLSFVVSVHADDADGDAPKAQPLLGSAIFDVGAVLAAPGNTMGKEIAASNAPCVIVNLEPYGGSGTLTMQLNGESFQNTEGMGVFNKSDPFYELQRKRRVLVRNSVKEGVSPSESEGMDCAYLWDCVFRSKPIQNNLSPRWEDVACLELSMLCEKGSLDEAFRLAVYDYDDKSAHDFMGSCEMTVTQALEAASTKGKLAITKDGDEVGKIVIVAASTEGVPEPSEEEAASRSRGQLDQAVAINAETEEETIVVEAILSDGDNEVAEDIVIMADELDLPSFVDYVRGGCELKVAVAVDFSASNGDPRKEDSLHYFHRRDSDKRNDYEVAIDQICSILAEYDSDQNFPLWGFGAKVNGAINHCFACRDPSSAVDSSNIQAAEVHGVGGIVEAYKKTFTAGVVMSHPSDITQVIRAGSQHARQDLNTALQNEVQAYSVLLIFTNGDIENQDETLDVIRSVENEPLSIVIVGVGPADFSELQRAIADQCSSDGRRDFVRFVDMKQHKSGGGNGANSDLSTASIQDVPDQMVRYFVKHDIQPGPPIPQEFSVEPFDAAEARRVNVSAKTNGEIMVKVQGGGTASATMVSPDSFNGYISGSPDDGNGGGMAGAFGDKTKTEMMNQGKRMFKRHKRVFGRMQRTYQKQFDRMVDGKIKNMLPKFK